MDTKNWRGQLPQRIDTHISSVFLVGDRAWKLKKAVKFNFVDFSTLDLRRLSCQREVEFNRLFAPDLYLGLDRITRLADGRLAWNGEGETVEWLVCMRRFPADAGLTEILARGQADRTQFSTLVQTLWTGYGRAEIHFDAGGKQGFRDIIDGLAPGFGPDLPAELFAAWRNLVEIHGARLDQRRRQGWVRRCHGDLHLGNICLYEGALLPFDVLEFNDQLSIIDMAYDLAFLIMDLLAHGYDDFAALVFNRYLDVSGDYSGVALMPLFVSLRAGVRAMVMSTQNRRQDAARYLKLAERVLSPPKPRLVAVGGLSGSGKSRLSSRLSPILACPAAAIIRSDAIRKRLMGVAQTAKLGEEGYTPDINREVYRTLYQACGQILADGCAVIADAVFSRVEERDAIQACGYPFTGLWLEAPFEVAAERVETRRGDASDATRSVLEAQTRRDVGPITWTRIDSGGDREMTVAQAMAALNTKV